MIKKISCWWNDYKIRVCGNVSFTGIDWGLTYISQYHVKFNCRLSSEWQRLRIRYDQGCRLYGNILLHPEMGSIMTVYNVGIITERIEHWDLSYKAGHMDYADIRIWFYFTFVIIIIYTYLHMEMMIINMDVFKSKCEFVLEDIFQCSNCHKKIIVLWIEFLPFSNPLNIILLSIDEIYSIVLI